MFMVTGGAGFIGSNLVAALGERGAEVVVCDSFGSDGKWRNLAKHPVADIVAPDALTDYVESEADALEAVVHLGAETSTAETDVDLLLRRNFHASAALWRVCARRGVRLIYASSAATYGDGAAGFDDSAPLDRLRPLNPYGWSKHLFDRRAAALAESPDTRPPQWAGLKFFNVYGPNEYHKGPMQSVVARKFAAAAAGEPVSLFRSHRPDCADGAQKRDFVHVADCVAVMLWLLDNPAVNGLYNVGTGEARAFADLAAALQAACGKRPGIVYVDMPPGVRDRYQYFTRAEVGRLRAAGYAAPFRSLEEGVADYVARFLATGDPYR